MNLLAIETATETVGVAVGTEAGVRAELTLTGRRRHVETLTPAIEHLCLQVGLAIGDLGAVAVDVGPGLFTGLRVGVATAKGLAQALGIGVIVRSSLEILVRAAADAGHRGQVLAAVDARRGEVFATMCEVAGRAGSQPAEILAPGLFTPAALAGALGGLAGQPVLAFGDGAQRYADQLGAVPGVTCVTGALAFPPPGTLLAMAAEPGATPVDPQSVVPLYMREADARSNFAQASRV
jgi:tRNA threonylcarbamoyladenosine biosynthesis protein TsaB